MSLRPDEMASRTGFDPRAAVWWPLAYIDVTEQLALSTHRLRIATLNTLPVAQWSDVCFIIADKLCIITFVFQQLRLFVDACQQTSVSWTRWRVAHANCTDLMRIIPKKCDFDDLRTLPSIAYCSGHFAQDLVRIII